MEVNALRLLDLALNIGIRVVWIADSITAEQAETLRGVWAICGGELPTTEQEASLPGFQLRQLEPEYDPMTAAIEAHLNVRCTSGTTDPGRSGSQSPLPCRP